MDVDIQRGNILKIYHPDDLFNLFPNLDFGEIIRQDEKNEFIQSRY